MLNKIKKYKLLSIMLILTVISLIIGLFLNTLLSIETKKTITNNINLLINNKLLNYKELFINNILITISIWILGISIIGIIVILIIYICKVVIFSFEVTSLLSTLGIKNILLILIYSLPNLLNIIIYFIICYYATTYSIYLIRHIFFNKKYNMYQITKKYILILIISLIIIIISTSLEIFILMHLKLFKI